METMSKLPNNLVLLHGGEEDLRSKSIAIVEADAELMMHLDLIEICLDMFQFIRMHYEHDDEDQLIVKLIGATVFNAAASALRLILSGYYQASGLQLRLILETGWLLDYFTTDDALIQEWKVTSEDKRQNVFPPGMIRQALDERDCFKAGKRSEHYKKLCVLCGHPTFAGFEMLRPRPGEDAHMGPFLVPALLEQCIQELVKVTLTAWEAFFKFFPPVSPQHFRATLRFREARSAWTEKVFGKPIGGGYLDDVRQALADLAPYEDRH